LHPGEGGYPYTPQNNPQQYGLNYYGDPNKNCSSGSGNSYDGSNPRLDTDGGDVYSYIDPRNHHSKTAYGHGLDASRDPYVVVDDPSQLGQLFLVTDQNTGRSIVAIGGDTGHGFGEISPATAQGLGMWEPSRGDDLPRHHITITPYNNSANPGSQCDNNNSGGH
jgi:hypothetical protein